MNHRIIQVNWHIMQCAYIWFIIVFDLMTPSTEHQKNKKFGQMKQRIFIKRKPYKKLNL